LYQNPAPVNTTCKAVYPEYFSIANWFAILMWTKFGGLVLSATLVGGTAILFKLAKHGLGGNDNHHDNHQSYQQQHHADDDDDHTSGRTTQAFSGQGRALNS